VLQEVIDELKACMCRRGVWNWSFKEEAGAENSKYGKIHFMWAKVI
jgi:hypothetical protein